VPAATKGKKSSPLTLDFRVFLGQVPDRQPFSGGVIFGHAEDKT